MKNGAKALIAGGVGAIATLPQAVAYGLIAFAPLGADGAALGVASGIASAVLFGLITGTFGSNPVLISGPRAVTAVVVATALSTGLDRGLSAETALALAFAGVMAAGLFQFLFGVLRLGQLVSYVPVPVLAGFVSASAVLVFLSSLPMALGLGHLSLNQLLIDGQLLDALLWAIVVSLVTAAAIFACDKRLRIVPAALVGLIVGGMVYFVGTELIGLSAGPLVGAIDLALLLQSPIPTDLLPGATLALNQIDIILLAGLSIALLASFDTVLSSLSLEAETGRRSKVNQDLALHGLANLAMGGLALLPGSGTWTRSTAVIRAGGKTRVANLSCALVLLVLVVGLAQVVALLPLWAAAAMLMATAVQALDRDTLLKATRVYRGEVPFPRVVAGDVLVTLTVVAVAVAIDLIAAVGTGIILAAILFLLSMGRDPVRRTYTGSFVHSKVQRTPQQIELLEREGHRIAVVEIQGPLFFGSAAALRTQVMALFDKGAEYLILDGRHLTSIDSTGSAAIRQFHLRASEVGGRVLISNIEPERRLPRWSGLLGGAKALAARRRDQRVWTPRWIWLNLQANGVITQLGADGLEDDTDSALARAEDWLLRHHGLDLEGNRIGILAACPLFDGLDRAAIMGLGRYGQRRFFDAGEPVFIQGDQGGEAYLLVRGRMEVLIDIPDSNRTKRLSLLTEGSLFGEMGLIDGAGRSATVRTTRPSICYAMSGEAFRRLETEHPEIALLLFRNVSKQLALRLRVANNMISELEQ